MTSVACLFIFFFFNDTATTEIYTLSLHDALPISPGIVGGGEEKALPQIKQLAEMDAAEGHYAAGNCRRQKKDFTVADEEFRKALVSNPKSAELIYDIGDYAVRRGQPERLLAAGGGRG